MANNFSRDVADKLLDKLSTDDNFRDLFLKNPRAALHQVGHETPEADRGVAGLDPVLCASVDTLATKEQIKASRETLQAQMTTAIFGFDLASLSGS